MTPRSLSPTVRSSTTTSLRIHQTQPTYVKSAWLPIISTKRCVAPTTTSGMALLVLKWQLITVNTIMTMISVRLARLATPSRTTTVAPLLSTTMELFAPTSLVKELVPI